MVKWLNSSNLNKLMEVLDPCMAVGGCVRNYILGKNLNGEVDLATPLLPEEVMKKAKKAGFKVIPTGLQHGTVTCIMDEDIFEITTLRVDVETYGRHAKVEFSNSWEEDAKRRDLTINALYADINGEIHDFVGGLDDIKSGIIKFIGNPHERIKEDYLRILRFFRFFAHYGKKYDKTSLSACAEHVTQLKTIARERCIAELIKLLDADNFLHTLKLMNEIDIWKYCDFPSPNFEMLENLIQNETNLFKNETKASFLAKLASFSGDFNKVKLSNLHKRYIMLLQKLDPMHNKKSYIEWINTAPKEVWNDGFLLKGHLTDLSFLEIWKDHLFYFSGHDIQRITTCDKGPKIKEYLDKLKTWFILQESPPSYQQLEDYLQTIK